MNGTAVVNPKDLHEVAATAKSGTFDTEFLERRITEIDSSQDEHQAPAGGFFGIEIDAKPLVEKINESQARRAAEKKVLQGQLEGIKQFEGRYRPVDPSVLRLRDKHGWPRFIPFLLNSPIFRLSTKDERNEPSNYLAGLGSYDDVKQRLGLVLEKRTNRVASTTFTILMAIVAYPALKYNQGWWFAALGAIIIGLVAGATYNDEHQQDEHFIESKYSGIIPNDVRAKIHEAKRDFGDRIIILTEAPKKWQVGSVRVNRPRLDPLVLGYMHGQFWLITEYDTTPAEEWVKNNFMT